MDIFDPHYDVEIEELIYYEQNRKTIINGQIGYVIDDE